MPAGLRRLAARTIIRNRYGAKLTQRVYDLFVRSTTACLPIASVSSSSAAMSL